MGARVSAGRGMYRWVDRLFWPGILVFLAGFWCGVGLVLSR